MPWISFLTREDYDSLSGNNLRMGFFTYQEIGNTERYTFSSPSHRYPGTSIFKTSGCCFLLHCNTSPSCRNVKNVNCLKQAKSRILTYSFLDKKCQASTVSHVDRFIQLFQNLFPTSQALQLPWIPYCPWHEAGTCLFSSSRLPPAGMSIIPTFFPRLCLWFITDVNKWSCKE